MWVRLHKPPHKFTKNMLRPRTAKESYYIECSFKRYLKTKDGNYLNSIKNLLPEIGRLDSIRFISGQ